MILEAMGEQALHCILCAFLHVGFAMFTCCSLACSVSVAGSGHFEECWSGGRPRKVAKQFGSCLSTASQTFVSHECLHACRGGT